MDQRIHPRTRGRGQTSCRYPIALAALTSYIPARLRRLRASVALSAAETWLLHRSRMRPAAG